MSGMPGSTIAGIAQSQIAHAASFQSYGNFISDQYGTRKTPASQAGVSGGGSTGHDPRFQPYLPQARPYGLETSLAMGAAGIGRTGMDVGLGAASLAGGFGMLPRIFDPFTTTLGMAGAGARWGGASGAVGFGSAALGGYMAAGAGMNMVAGQVMGGMQNQAQLSGMFGQGWNRQNMPMMQGAPSFGQQVSMGNMMAGMAGSDPLMSMGSLTGLMGQGMAGGSFRGSTNFGDFKAKFQQLVSEVRTVAETFSTSLNEAYSVIQRVQGMGFYGAGKAGQAAQSFSGLASATGMRASEMFSAVSTGADMWTGMGGSRATGGQVVGGVAGQLSSMANSGMLSGSAIRDMFGGASLGDAIPALAGRLTEASSRFGGTRYGQQVLGAMMDPETGRIDPMMAAQLGSMSWGDISGAYSRNMRTPGAKRMLQSRAGGLTRQMMETVGPEWSAMGIGALSSHKGGGVPGVEEYMSQVYGSIPQQELDILTNMANAGPEMKTMMRQSAQDALRAGVQEAKQNRSNSWEAVKGKLKQAFVQPITAPLRKFGREVLGNMQTWIGDYVDEFLGTEAGVLNTDYMNDWRAKTAIGAPGGGIPSAYSGSGGLTSASLPGLRGGFGSMVNNWVPGGIGNVLQGGGFAAGGSVGLSNYNPGATGLTAASLPLFGGRSAVGALGMGIQRGVGGISGTLAGGALRGIGAGLARGSGAMLGMELMGNYGPEVWREGLTLTGDVMTGHSGVSGPLAEIFDAQRLVNPGLAYGQGGLAQYSLNSAPSGFFGLEAGGRGAGAMGMIPGQANVGSFYEGHGFDQAGFANRGQAQVMAADFANAMRRPQAFLGADEGMVTAMGGMLQGVDTGWRKGDRAGGYEASRGQAIVNMLRASGRRDYEEYASRIEQRGIQGLTAAFVAAGGTPMKATMNAANDIAATSKTPARAMRLKGLGALYGKNFEEDPNLWGEWMGKGGSSLVQNLSRGRGEIPGLMADIHKFAVNPAGQDAMLSTISSRLSVGDERYVPTEMRDAMLKKLGSFSAGPELRGMVEDATVFHGPDYVDADHTRQSRRDETSAWLNTSGGATTMGMLVPGMDNNELRGDIINAAGGQTAGLADDFAGMDQDQLRGLGAVASFPSGEGHGDLKESSKMYFAHAGTYARSRERFARYLGPGRSSSRASIAKGVAQKDLPEFLKRIYGKSSYWGQISQAMPSMATGKGSKTGLYMMALADQELGHGGDFTKSMALALDASKGTGVDSAEAQDLIKGLYTAAVTGSGGTGKGSGTLDATMEKFKQSLDSLAGKIQGIAAKLPGEN